MSNGHKTSAMPRPAAAPTARTPPATPTTRGSATSPGRFPSERRLVTRRLNRWVLAARGVRGIVGALRRRTVRPSGPGMARQQERHRSPSSAPSSRCSPSANAELRRRGRPPEDARGRQGGGPRRARARRAGRDPDLGAAARDSAPLTLPAGWPYDAVTQIIAVRSAPPVATTIARHVRPHRPDGRPDRRRPRSEPSRSGSRALRSIRDSSSDRLARCVHQGVHSGRQHSRKSGSSQGGPEVPHDRRRLRRRPARRAAARRRRPCHLRPLVRRPRPHHLDRHLRRDGDARRARRVHRRRPRPRAGAVRFNPMVARGLLAIDKVRYVGEPVAVVVTEDRATRARTPPSRSSSTTTRSPRSIDMEASHGQRTPASTRAPAATSCSTPPCSGMPENTGDAFFEGCEVVVSRPLRQPARRPVPARGPRLGGRLGATAGCTSGSSTQGAQGAKATIVEGATASSADQVPSSPRTSAAASAPRSACDPEEALLGVLAAKVGRPLRWRETRTEIDDGARPRPRPGAVRHHRRHP